MEEEAGRGSKVCWAGRGGPGRRKRRRKTEIIWQPDPLCRAGRQDEDTAETGCGEKPPTQEVERRNQEQTKGS